VVLSNWLPECNQEFPHNGTLLKAVHCGQTSVVAKTQDQVKTMMRDFKKYSRNNRHHKPDALVKGVKATIGTIHWKGLPKVSQMKKRNRVKDLSLFLHFFETINK